VAVVDANFTLLEFLTGVWILIATHLRTKFFRRSLGWVSVLFLGLSIAFFARADTPATPPEHCLDCHSSYEKVEANRRSDPHALLPCSSCHLGDSSKNEKSAAHQGLIRTPGLLENAKISCDPCHSRASERVSHSLMNTGRGMIAVNRFAFGEQPTPNGNDTIADLGKSPADEHFRQLCIDCHLSSQKVPTQKKKSGCNLCHLKEPDLHQNGFRTSTFNQFKKLMTQSVLLPSVIKQSIYKTLPNSHPTYSLNIDDTRCFSCHSRSSRISLNYSGWSESAEVNPAPDAPGRHLDDGRLLIAQAPDIHYTLGLTCIDCHTSQEVMGRVTPESKNYQHQEQAIAISCEDCHTNKASPSIAQKDLDAESIKLLRARGGLHLAIENTRYVLTRKSKEPLYQVVLNSESTTSRPQLDFIYKSRVKKLRLTPPRPECTATYHRRLSCQSCHSAWTPQCLGCHTERDKEGLWQESAGTFLARPPTLGVTAQNRIEPVIPGMIMTLKKSQNEPEKLIRLFAPTAPHTTQKKGRSCQSCHEDPVTVGLGSGTLNLSTVGAPVFVSEFETLSDGLPADAWVGLREDQSPNRSTRTGLRPFNAIERKRIFDAIKSNNNTGDTKRGSPPGK
jgi:hypothetical protein